MAEFGLRIADCGFKIEETGDSPSTGSGQEVRSQEKPIKTDSPSIPGYWLFALSFHTVTLFWTSLLKS
jgi:hypothetical protein